MARMNDNKDIDYSKRLFHNETWLTLAGMLIHIPLFWFAPVFTFITILYASIYIVLHRKSHEHVEFFKKWMPWHYEHHMGVNQNANWCVVFPLMDYIMGTRVKWLDKT